MLTSTMTVVEAAGAKIEAGHLGWALSGLSVVPVTEDDALTAHRLLSENGMHGHKYAIDGVVAALALRSPGPVAVLTSDPNDMAALCGPKVHVVRI